MAIKLPESFLKASATISEKVAASTSAKKVQATTAGQAVTARIDMSAEVAGAGLCPECHKPMKEGMANGMPVQYCLSHRIALPISDSAIEGQPAPE